MKWHDATEIGIRGRGWPDAAQPYARLPAHAEGKVTDVVWRLSRQSAGLYVEFISDTDIIHGRMQLAKAPAEGHEYIKYLDLYCRDNDGHWRWAGVSRFGVVPSGETPVIEGIPRQQRQWRLYLPLTYAVEHLEIGVGDDASIAPPPGDPRKPIVIYGTSIVHGGNHISRPGMVWPSIVGRRLDWPLVNLGFSGSARCEPPLAEILAELDPAVFVIDPLANMGRGRELVDKNAEPFLRILLEARPETPVVMMDDRTHADAWLRPGYPAAQREKQKAFRNIADRLRNDGYPVAYVEGADLIGRDSEGTRDGSHPNDLGAMRYADAVVPRLQEVLKT